MNEKILHNRNYLTRIYQVINNGTLNLSKMRLGFFPLFLRNIDFDFGNFSQEYEISITEHFLMCNVDQGLDLPPESLANSAVSYGEGDFRGEFTKAEYLSAINTCVSKGLFELYPCLDEAEKINLVRFTEKGYFIHRKIIEKIFGLKNIQYNDSGWKLFIEKNEIHVYGETQEVCEIRIQELEDESELYIGEHIIMTGSNKVDELSEWKPNQFAKLSKGYRYIIKYHVADQNE